MADRQALAKTYRQKLSAIEDITLVTIPNTFTIFVE
jgi:hypothetical protein